ncbi:GTP cyclohydrolase I [Purpureocillium takamizusanense]|uniref:GTP cyclohydrolase 1 n=1 Tax=Purpureocillium takamizusanense TaxID=2060973 RepID=A0A9Q8QGP0_9HYPO|nr:GTP cyclohydrolase I [Purpureocillium takamizusanense]UNI18526.1 GTP cyclohydrolase I [Purpureocillium takamizusanense]
MAQTEDVDMAATTKKRSLDSASVSGSSTSDESTRKRRRNRNKNRKSGSPNGDVAVVNGAASARRPSAFDQRRNSLGKAARDPRDEPPPKKRAPVAGQGQKVRPPSPVIDYDGLSRPTRGTRQRREEDPEQAEKRLDKMRGAVRTLLECVGEDPDREGLLDTPSRYAKALLFLTKGYQVNVEDIVNNALFHEGHNEMVIVKDIEIHSLCEHHLVPFIGKMHIGYIPSDTVIGLSKLPRIAEMYARRLQIQERLTKEVAHAIMEILKPQGVAVVMESSHLCMVMRGVQQTSTSTITSCVLGCFERKSKTRNEFLSLVGVNRT